MSDCPNSWPIKVQVRPLLSFGCYTLGPQGIRIMLAAGQPKYEAAVTLWHEIVHVLMRTGGHPKPASDQELAADEEKVEALAKKLAAACPEVLDLCGVERHFT